MTLKFKYAFVKYIYLNEDRNVVYILKPRQFVCVNLQKFQQIPG